MLRCTPRWCSTATTTPPSHATAWPAPHWGLGQLSEELPALLGPSASPHWPQQLGANISGPPRFKPPKFHAKTKARNFGPPTLQGPTLRGPTLRGPPFPPTHVKKPKQLIPNQNLYEKKVGRSRNWPKSIALHNYHFPPSNSSWYLFLKSTRALYGVAPFTVEALKNSTERCEN